MVRVRAPGRRMMWIALTVAVVGGGFYAAMRPKPVTVEAAEIRRGRFEETLRTDGRFESRERHVVRAHANGSLRRVELQIGDAVDKGQLLTHLDWDRTDAIRAPIGGVVSKIHRDSAGPINRGEPILEIVDPSLLEVVLELLTTDAVRAKKGQEVRIDSWGGPPLTGVIATVSRAGFVKLSALGVEEERTEVRAQLRDPPKEVFRSLGDRFHLEATVILSVHENALAVPVGALFRAEGGWAAYVIEDSVARMRFVKTAEQNPREAIVTEGLGEGERVILYPSDRIRPGVPVRVAD